MPEEVDDVGLVLTERFAQGGHTGPEGPALDLTDRGEDPPLDLRIFVGGDAEHTLPFEHSEHDLRAVVLVDDLKRVERVDALRLENELRVLRGQLGPGRPHEAAPLVEKREGASRSAAVRNHMV